MTEFPKNAKLTLDGKEALHFIAKAIRDEAKKNAIAKGGHSFWRSIAQSMSYMDDGNDVIVGAKHIAAGWKQLAEERKNGVMEAPGLGPQSVHAKYLTIPVNSARRNRWYHVKDAKNNGVVIFRPKKKNGEYYDILLGEIGRKKPEVMYILKKRVIQEDHKFFPEGSDLLGLVDTAVKSFVKRKGLIK